MENNQIERYMLYLDNQLFATKDANKILTLSRDKTSTKEIIIRDVRVSKNFIELDISVSKGELQSIIDLLTEIGKLNEIINIKERTLKKEEAIEKGIDFFNNERYWLSHEVLEGVWKRTFNWEKELLNGLILIAAAFVHHQKNDDERCLSILERAMKKLINIDGKYHEINIDLIKSNIKKILNEKKIFRFTI